MGWNRLLKVCFSYSIISYRSKVLAVFYKRYTPIVKIQTQRKRTCVHFKSAGSIPFVAESWGLLLLQVSSTAANFPFFIITLLWGIRQRARDVYTPAAEHEVDDNSLGPVENHSINYGTPKTASYHVGSARLETKLICFLNLTFLRPFYILLYVCAMKDSLRVFYYDLYVVLCTVQRHMIAFIYFIYRAHSHLVNPCI